MVKDQPISYYQVHKPNNTQTPQERRGIWSGGHTGGRVNGLEIPFLRNTGESIFHMFDMWKVLIFLLLVEECLIRTPDPKTHGPVDNGTC